MKKNSYSVGEWEKDTNRQFRKEETKMIKTKRSDTQPY